MRPLFGETRPVSLIELTLLEIEQQFWGKFSNTAALENAILVLVSQKKAWEEPDTPYEEQPDEARFSFAEFIDHLIDAMAKKVSDFEYLEEASKLPP